MIWERKFRCRPLQGGGAPRAEESAGREPVTVYSSRALHMTWTPPQESPEQTTLYQTPTPDLWLIGRAWWRGGGWEYIFRYRSGPLRGDGVYTDAATAYQRGIERMAETMQGKLQRLQDTIREAKHAPVFAKMAKAEQAVQQAAELLAEIVRELEGLKNGKAEE